MITKRRKTSKFDVKYVLDFTNEKNFFLVFFKKNRPGSLNTEVSVTYSVSSISSNVQTNNFYMSFSALQSLLSI